MHEIITKKKFSEIPITDIFFDSLRADYDGFDKWFDKKKDEEAYVQYDTNNKIQAFLYLKIEKGALEDVSPQRKVLKRLKVGTFKIDAHNTKLGERFIKIITDRAIAEDVSEVYVTIYSKQEGLINLLSKYGFANVGKKQGEEVLVKDMKSMTGENLKDFPLISLSGKRKFVLSIYPKFHTKLFPDSILKNEENYKEELIKDVSYTNSIHKVYICFMGDTKLLKKGDLIAIYRTSDYLGPARFRSVITSICQIDEVKTKSDFNNVEDFINYTNTYSIFEEKDLRYWYKTKDCIVLKMTYNIALNKRVTQGYLLDNLGLSPDIYWGFFPLTDEQFKGILTKGEVDENIIIN